MPGGSRWALPPLDNARVDKIRGRDLLVLGYEEIASRREVSTYRQAWWCRVVSDESGAAVDEEVMELASALLDRIQRQRRQPPAEAAEGDLVPG